MDFSFSGIANAVTKPFRKPEGYVSAKEEEAQRAAAAKAAPAPAPAPQQQPTQIGGVNLGATQRREKEAGLKHGGKVKGPGTGTSDSVPANLSNGEYVMPADSVKKIGVRKLDAMRMATHKFVDPKNAPKLGAKGAKAFMNGGCVGAGKRKGYADGGLISDEDDTLTASIGGMPQQAEQLPQNAIQSFDVGSSRLGARRRLVDQPQGYADGGLVDDEQKRRTATGAAQIPGQSFTAPPSDGTAAVSSEVARNVNNGLNALGGMGVVASVPLRAAATAAPAVERLAGPARTAADFVVNGAGQAERVAALPVPTAIATAAPTLPAAIPGLMEGARANQVAATARTVGNANAAAVSADRANASEVPLAPLGVRGAPGAPGGAVFGMYPAAAGTRMSSVATDNRLRTGYTADGAPASATAAPSVVQALPPGVQPSTAGAGRGTAVMADPIVGAVGNQQGAPTTPQVPGSPGADAAAQWGGEGRRTAAMGAAPGAGTLPEGVTKTVAGGRTTYSNVPGEAALPKLGAISPQNDAAAQALSDKYRGESLALIARGQQPKPEIPFAGLVIPPDAQGRWHPAMQAQLGAIAEANKEAAATGRTQIQDAGSTQRNRDTIAAEAPERVTRAATGVMQVSAARDIAKLQAQYQAATSDKEREKLREAILLLQGKDRPTPPSRYTVVPGGQEIVDGQVVRTPAQVLDNDSGEFVKVPSQKAAPKFNAGQVYQDAQGRKAKWDGEKFVPV